ncbi:DUF4145 domain-containing protein [Thiorhodovibrio frisius]|uniref:DUF4145 domain-containing protein n=1 Tax=Thiorhodovibrio frisius TaxID=631362 RepID=H8Z6A3_9GAMM|nr:DUF4145 domain-containing protein [Thiorhodovibrio frisius]EIC20687.1 hypothetical protein Thi970DRAFT_04342 [Thiorhodovibrio frisius]WPL21435.1 hypothetical protein Thiofri_01560 [Thiorhodovibrio frisius]
MANGKSADERLADLEQTVVYLSRLIVKAQQYAVTDPEVALGQARKSAEAICCRLFQAEIGKPGKMMLDELITKLQARQVIPPDVLVPLRTIQMYGNFGVHAQDGHREISAEWVAPCLSALAQVTTWYFTDYLGVALPSTLERSSDDRPPPDSDGGEEPTPEVETLANNASRAEEPVQKAQTAPSMVRPVRRWRSAALPAGLLLVGLAGVGGYLYYEYYEDRDHAALPIAPVTQIANGMSQWPQWEIEKGTYMADEDTSIFRSSPTSLTIKQVSKPKEKDPSRSGICQSIKTDNFRGKRIKYSAFIKVSSLEQWAYMYVLSGDLYPVEGIKGSKEQPLEKDWSQLSMVFGIPESHEKPYIKFCFSLWGGGQMWIDDVKWDVVNNTTPVTYAAPLSEPKL